MSSLQALPRSEVLFAKARLNLANGSVTRGQPINRPTRGEVVFLSDGSPCFKIIAPFVLKVEGIRIKVIKNS